MAYAPVQETLAPVVGGTPDEVERYRKLAEALMAQAGSGEPVEHWMEGVGRLAQALSGGLVERKAAKLEREGEAGARQAILDNLDLFAGGGGYGDGEVTGGETADVPGTEPIAATGDDADMIIRTVIGEAAGEPPEGQQAVASVIMNRARQSGMSPSQVVLAKGQFEPWGSRGRQLRAIDPNSEQYRRVAAAVMPVLQGRARDPTGGATHFYAPKAQAALGRSTPSWAQGQGLDIGNHRFYSLGYGGGGRHGIPGETADIPGAEPIGFAPSPDVMAHITGGGATPAGISIQETPTITGAPPPGGAGTVPMPPVAVPPVAAPVARVPQPRPTPPVAAAPAAPAVTGSVIPAAPVAPRPVTMPPVKNDYAQFPGQRPSVAPVRPGQLMNEPYPGVMSAQEFARQGQAAMRARAAGQQPATAPVAGTAPQPRRNLLQALLGRGAPQGPASPPAAPVAPAAPAGGAVAPVDDRRARIASFLANPRVPDAYKLAALKRLSPQEREDYTLGRTRFSGRTNEPIASVLEEGKVTTRPLTVEERAARGISPNDPKLYQIDSTGKVSQVGGGGLNIDLSGGGTEKQIYETLGASADSARAAVTGLKGIQEARKAVEGGIITGAGANIRLPLQKLGALLGVADPRIIENTETFRAAIAPQVAALLKATVGTAQISNTDREFAERAAGGDITLDETSIKRLLDIMDKAGRVAVETHRQKLDAVYPESGDYARERALFGVEMPETEEEPPQASDQQTTLDAARDAIARGADPEAVRRRLQESGIDPGLL